MKKRIIITLSKPNNVELDNGTHRTEWTNIKNINVSVDKNIDVKVVEIK